LNYGAFSTVASLSGNVSVFIDFNVNYAGSGPSSARYRIKSRDLSDYESAWSNIVTVQYGNVDKALANNDVVQVKPGHYYLTPNYPNPFNPSTKIRYALMENAEVQIKVYDMLGTEVAELVNETKAAGFYETTFEASNLSSGVYIYRITAMNGERILFSESKRMILMK
jgi:hypothetical protein